MYWIYIAPIVFLAGLVALVVILGKKTAAIKKRKDLFPEYEKPHQFVGGGAKWYKKAWLLILRFLENFIYYIRVGAKKSESGLAGAMNKIKEKRFGKKDSSISIAQQRIKELEVSSDSLYSDDKKIDRVEKTIRQNILKDIDFIPEEVVVKKKPEITPRRIVHETIPEDKIREDALIHRIAENPKDIEAYRELGDYYLAIANIKDAKESFKMVLKLRPRDLKAKSSLREIELRMRLRS
jgi:hypothetical protein